MKKREKESVMSNSVTAGPTAAATNPHSTTSGQGAAAVSTTSVAPSIKRGKCSIQWILPPECHMVCDCVMFYLTRDLFGEV